MSLDDRVGEGSDLLYVQELRDFRSSQPIERGLQLRALAGMLTSGQVLAVPHRREQAHEAFWDDPSAAISLVRADRSDDGSWVVQVVADRAGARELAAAGLGEVLVLEHLGADHPEEPAEPRPLEEHEDRKDPYDPELAERGLYRLGVRARWAADAVELVHDVAGLGASAKGTLAPNRVCSPCGLVIQALSLPIIPLSPLDPEQPPWPLDPPEPLQGAADVTVAVLDTGFAVGVRATDLFANAEDASEHDVEPEPGDEEELAWAAGHGTFVGGLVARFAPEARLVGYRVFEPGGIGDDATLARALHHALHVLRADIVNLSLGFYDALGATGCPPLTEAVVAGAPFGSLIVAAAGNDSLVEVPCWPAALPNVLAVSADDLLYANKASWVDLSTKGRWVSAFRVGREAEELDDDGDPEVWKALPAVANWEGTSFATAAVTGALANQLLLGCSPVRALTRLSTRGHEVPGLGTVVPVAPRRPAT